MGPPESGLVGAQDAPVGEPPDELVALVGDGEPLVVGGPERVDGVLERVGRAEARDVTGERRGIGLFGALVDRAFHVAGGDDADQ